MSTDERTLLSTLTQVQAQALHEAKEKAVAAANYARETSDTYHVLLVMAMPPGANSFDAETMSFYYDPAQVPNGGTAEADVPPPPSGPALVTDDS